MYYESIDQTHPNYINISDEERVANYFEACGNGSNLYSMSSEWDEIRGEYILTKSVNLFKPWYVVSFYQTQNPMNYHAHIETYASDCDGPTERSFIDWLHEMRDNDNMDSWDFEARMMRLHIETHNPDATMNITESGFFTTAPNDEGGGCSTYVRYCYDWSCDDKPTYRDIRAESMGY